MTYSDNLRDPRWQKLRLQVLERAGWRCQCCADSKSTLHVHHLVYSGEPWNSPINFLECLCEDCHAWREHWNDAWGGRSTFSTIHCQILSAVLRHAFTTQVEQYHP